jgi:hypothetical protein
MDTFFNICSYLVLHCSGIGLSNGRLYRIVLHAVDFSSRKNPTTSVGSIRREALRKHRWMPAYNTANLNSTFAHRKQLFDVF